MCRRARWACFVINHNDIIVWDIEGGEQLHKYCSGFSKKHLKEINAMLSHDRDCYGSTGKVAAARKHRRGMVKRTRIAERASSCSRKQSARSSVRFCKYTLIFTLSQFTNVSIFNLECPGKNKLKSITFQVKRIAFREQLNTHNFPELKISMA